MSDIKEIGDVETIKVANTTDTISGKKSSKKEDIIDDDPDTCLLIYDMKCVTHSYQNPNTKNITTGYLFREIMDKPGTRYTTSKEAYMRHCEIFNGTNYAIAEDPHDVDGIICMHLFEYTNEAGLDVIVTIIGFDNKKIESYYIQHSTVPNIDFIKKTCIYHIS